MSCDAPSGFTESFLIRTRGNNQFQRLELTLLENRQGGRRTPVSNLSRKKSHGVVAIQRSDFSPPRCRVYLLIECAVALEKTHLSDRCTNATNQCASCFSNSYLLRTLLSHSSEERRLGKESVRTCK